jgi:hypothetical protein
LEEAVDLSSDRLLKNKSPCSDSTVSPGDDGTIQKFCPAFVDVKIPPRALTFIHALRRNGAIGDMKILNIIAYVVCLTYA